MKTSLVSLLLSLSLSALVPTHARANPEVEKGVRAVAANLRRGWDARDMNTYMACFAQPEGLFVWGGSTLTLQDMKNRVEKAWDERSSDSWTNDEVEVIVIDRNSALLQITWSGRFTLKTGATWEFKGSSFGTYLVRKFGDRWKIVASHESARGTQVNAAAKKK